MQNCAQNHFDRLLGNNVDLDTFWNLNICLYVCRQAILDPENKRFESFISTKQNSLMIPVIVFPDSNTKNGTEFKNLEKYKNHISKQEWRSPEMAG